MQHLHSIQSYILDESHVHLWIIELPEWVKQARFEQLHQLKNERRLILERVLKNYLESPIVFRETASGKPFIEHHHLQFNTSHSGNFLAIAIHISTPLGVDIERLKCRDFKQFGARFWGEEFVNTHILNQRPAFQALAFFQAWTQTEAWVKCQGQTIFQFTDFSPQHMLSSQAWLYQEQKLISFMTFPGYTISLCMSPSVLAIHHQHIDLKHDAAYQHFISEQSQ